MLHLWPEGESWREIFSYWYPELITLFIITALPPLFDAYCVSLLSSTTEYATLGVSTNFIHMITKFSEALPVAAIAIIGRHNGAKKYEACGHAFVTTFWTTLIIGACFAVSLIYGAPSIYGWLGISGEMVAKGVPFLRLRAISLFFSFILLAFIGFFRAIKNTLAPLLITLAGTLVYIITSAGLILGIGPLPRCGMYGPAFASLAQYSVMLIIALTLMLSRPQYRRYFNGVSFARLDAPLMGKLLLLALPIMIDKTSLSFSYVWLARMIAPLGNHAIATFDIIKNLERAAIMPAAACAQVVTFLVSNHFGAGDRRGAYAVVMKVLTLTCIIVSFTLTGLWICAPQCVALVSPQESITLFAIPMLRTISIFVIFDLVQLILAGALRGAGEVYTVMGGRFVSGILFFIPASYLLAQTSTYVENPFSFGMVYALFYCSTALMGAFFFWRLRKSLYSARS